MPIYEYTCEAGHHSTSIRKVNGRNQPKRCDACGGPAKLTISHSNVNSWQSDWQFDHQSPFGDGKMSFPNESAFEANMKKNHAAIHSLGIREI